VGALSSLAEARRCCALCALASDEADLLARIAGVPAFTTGMRHSLPALRAVLRVTRASNCGNARRIGDRVGKAGVPATSGVNLLRKSGSFGTSIAFASNSVA
jgi:hypothetical protein